MSFEIQIGGENINPNPNDIIPAESMKNWETCKHRTDKVTHWVRSSCNCQPGSMVEMFRCIKLDISNLNPTICSTCTSFEPKSQ